MPHSNIVLDTDSQGDQIGRIFASWAIVHFGHFLKITEEDHMFGLLISKEKVMY
jgi:hypothetical protein